MKFTCLAGVASISVLTFQANAQENSPLETIYACSDVANDSERLACYDQAVGRTRQAEQSGEFRTFTRQEADEVQKDAFGFSLPSLPKFSMPSFGGDSDDLSGVKKNEEGEIEEIELAINRVSQDPYDKVLLVFENGQVWRQSDSNTVRLSRKRPPTSATIKRAGLGSFLFQLNTGERFKAKREQ